MSESLELLAELKAQNFITFSYIRPISVKNGRDEMCGQNENDKVLPEVSVYQLEETKRSPLLNSKT